MTQFVCCSALREAGHEPPAARRRREGSLQGRNVLLGAQVCGRSADTRCVIRRPSVSLNRHFGSFFLEVMQTTVFLNFDKKSRVVCCFKFKKKSHNN